MTISDEAVEAVVDVLERLAGMPPGEELAREVIKAAAPHLIAPVLELCDKADEQYGSSMYCKLTTYEVRQALDVK